MSFEDNVEHKGAWQSELKANGKNTPKVLVWDYRDRDELKTAWNSDFHYGNHSCDVDAFKRRVDYCAENGVPTVDIGDLIENATRDSVGSGVYDQTEIADEQMDAVIDIYRPLAEEGLLKVMQPGNHELRTYKSGGVNLTKIMCKMLGVPYAGAGLVHYIMVGDQRYIGYSTHGGSGATTVGGKMNSLLRLEKIVDADFYIQGHTHDTIHHARVHNVFDRRDRTLKERKRHFINNGAWLDYWNTYGQVKAYSPPNKGNAMILFDGEKHRIQVRFE